MQPLDAHCAKLVLPDRALIHGAIRDLSMKVPLESVPTSALIGAMLEHAPADVITVAWCFENLRRRSFGMVMFLLGLTAMIPGINAIAGLLLASVGVQMVMAHEAPLLPRFIAARPLPTAKISRLLERTIPIVSMLEKIIRPRWQTPFVATKRFVGVVVVLLGLTVLMPIPFSNVVPGAVTMLLACGYLEEDGIMLCVALTAAAASLAMTGMEAWAAMQGTYFLLRI